jgi:hypothetical protein
MMRYLTAVALVFIFLNCGSAFGEGNAGVLNLEVEGNAAISQNDIAGARDGAIQDALQRAILEAASGLLSISAKDEKFLPLKNEIIEQQDRYINNYKITSEAREPEIYSVTVNVAVALSDLKKDLAKMGFIQISGEYKANIILSLDVKGLKKYSDFSHLKEALKAQAGIVKNIDSQSFEWQQAHLGLEISGTAQELADKLADSGQYVLDTRQISKNQIGISFLQTEGE